MRMGLAQTNDAAAGSKSGQPGDRESQNQGETTGSESVSGLLPNENLPSQRSTGSQRPRGSAKDGPSVHVEQQNDHGSRIRAHVIHQESRPQLPELDLSSMSIGSGVMDISTGTMTYPDTASGPKARAPDGLYRLGNSIVSVRSRTTPSNNESDEQRKARLKEALDTLSDWMREEKAQMEEVTRQMGVLSVRAGFKEAVREMVSTRVNRVQAVEDLKAAEMEGRIVQDREIASLRFAEAKHPPGLAAQSKDKTQRAPQSKPPQPKVNKHKESSKFRPQKPVDLILRAPGLIKPPALTTPIEPRSIDMGMLQSLDALVHPLAQLRAYGYTTRSPTANEIQATLVKPDENAICKRCEKPFVYKDISWNKISKDNCVHHPGRCSVEVKGKKLASGKPMKVWSCCYRRGFSPGCTTGPTHVLEMQDASRLASLCPFEATPPSANTVDNMSKIQKVIALDCEMSFTKYGLTLSRMSVLLFPDCRVLEDIFIREPYPGVRFLDYNTRYSGVTHENIYPDDPENSLLVLEGITAARSKLWEYCDQNTIIIGHGLDHDLKCLRMLHPKIIDTAILFSKIEGQKSRLKKLAEEKLKWCIQEDVGELNGHDSVEDCRTCIELVLKYLQTPAVPVESAASEIPD